MIEHGGITASGTRDELMPRDGMYRELYLLQASAYEDIPETDAVINNERHVRSPLA